MYKFIGAPLHVLRPRAAWAPLAGARELVAFASSVMTLLPGDVVSLGTPEGVGPMRPGDVVEVTVGGIGTLRNPVRA